MKYNFKIENLDCAHCAAKIETEINKLDAVEKANVNYLSEKITVVSELDEETVFNNVKVIVARIEPDSIVSK
ncbi:MAG: hypothetical protein E7635_02830 [Ruminococcaceae bacterium]|nr:hypothetical protein [Oscillospiraceae bacterium]